MKNWISNNTKKPFYARKKFQLSVVQKSRLFCVGVGQFEVHVNGRKVGESVLEGSWTDYNKRIYYYSYDITEYLKIGENVIVAEIANGWYIADTDGERHFYTLDKGYVPFGECLAFVAELRIGDLNIETDATWEVAESRTTLANIYGSEDYDATRPLIWEEAVILDKNTAPKGELLPMEYPPVIVKKVYKGRNIGGNVYDLGQNMSGMFEVCAVGSAGDKIRVIPYEKLDKNGRPERTVDTWSVYTLTEGKNVFCPKFSTAGGRWIQVEKLQGNPDIQWVRGKYVTSGAEDVGFFRCSDERLNKIYEIIKAAIESNLHHCHTDCPTIEKLGWLEPNHLMGPSVMYLKNVDRLWSKIAADMRDAQYGADEFEVDSGTFPHEYGEGLIPSIAPRYARFTIDWGSGSFWDIIPWGSSLILGAWEQYRFYGNTQVIRDNYAAAKKYIRYLTKQYHDYERLYGKKGNFIRAGLGDWGLAQSGGDSHENIETAFFYRDLMIMAKFAEILMETCIGAGKTDCVGEESAECLKRDVTEFFALAETVKENYNRELLQSDESTGLCCYRAYDTPEYFRVTQTNQAIPLCFGLVPEEAVRDVQQALVNCFADGHFRAGEVGMPYVIRALSACGRNDLIYKAVVQEEHPSYYRFVLNGETTLPEFWRDDARSRNHDMLGHIMEWLFEEVGGIKVVPPADRPHSAEPGGAEAACTPGHIRVNEELMSGLEWVECEYSTADERIRVRKEKGKKTAVLREKFKEI